MIEAKEIPNMITMSFYKEKERKIEQYIRIGFIDDYLKGKGIEINWKEVKP